jgi:hypothetical protein
MAVWKNGVPSRGINASDALEYLEELRLQHNNELSPELVVESAKDPDSLIHPWFDWDDAEAAKKHRLDQARKLIRSIEVVRVVLDEPQPVRVFHVVRTERIESKVKTYFSSMDEILADADARQRLIEQARREAKALRDKYVHLVELSYLWENIDAGLNAPAALV